MAARLNIQRTLLLGVIISVAACGGVGIYCLVLGRGGRIEESILITTAAVAGASILALICIIPWERRKWHPVGPLGVTAAGVALAFSVIITWRSIWQYYADGLEELTAAAWVTAVAFAHVSILSVARLRKTYEWVRALTLMTTACLASLFYMIIFDSANRDLMRVIGSVAIVDVCATIGVFVLHRVSAICERESVKTVELAISLTCPRCGKVQELPAGHAKCAACGLKIRIEIEEEHCRKCGYSLYRLTSAACPECGTPIAESS